MSTFRLILSLAGFLAVSHTLAGDSDIVERIKKVGDVCIEGQDCATAPAPTQVAVAGGGDVEANYNKSCATCHNAGVAGAPRLGDVVAWEARLAKGMDVLYANSINGLPPAMPQKGMCFSCSDDELKALVDYMVETVR